MTFWKKQQNWRTPSLKQCLLLPPACKNNEHGREEVSNSPSNEEILFQGVINYLWVNPHMNTSKAEQFLICFTSIHMAQHNEMWAKLDVWLSEESNSELNLCVSKSLFCFFKVQQSPGFIALPQNSSNTQKPLIKISAKKKLISVFL